MEIIKARVMGFCMGVRRAVELALAEGAKNEGPVQTLGPLIHNPAVMERLRRAGITPMDEAAAFAEHIAGLRLIIRAHGIPLAQEEKLRQQGALLRDATCPKVKANQLKASELSKLGKTLFLAGEADHGEVIAVRGYAEGQTFVVATEEEAEYAASSLARAQPDASPALIAQTTFSEEELQDIARTIRRYFPSLLMVDSICGATRHRQEALRLLCTDTNKSVDAVLVVGGKNSANTRRLVSIAEKCGVRAWLVECAAEIPHEAFTVHRLGLSAGASTSDETVAEIESALVCGAQRIFP